MLWGGQTQRASHPDPGNPARQVWGLCPAPNDAKREEHPAAGTACLSCSLPRPTWGTQAEQSSPPPGHTVPARLALTVWLQRERGPLAPWLPCGRKGRAVRDENILLPQVLGTCTLRGSPDSFPENGEPSAHPLHLLEVGGGLKGNHDPMQESHLK